MRFTKVVFLFLGALVCALAAQATHNRAGEITYKQISQYTYEVTVITYTHKLSTSADRPKIDLIWGDNNKEEIQRTDKTDLGHDVIRNTYIHRHTYPGPGSFIIQFNDPNRIDNIININNSQSVSIPFYVETKLIINPTQGNNSSPILLQPPIDYAATKKIFRHNPNAYDPDGDSLSFKLIPPKKGIGEDVPNYTVPDFTNYFKLNVRTGELEWNTPTKIGVYNIAILIEEWRNNKRIGYITRDMQIIVHDNKSGNNPPKIEHIKDTCVEAGSPAMLNIVVTGIDADTAQKVTLTATGGPFLQKIKPAYIDSSVLYPGNPAKMLFKWDVQCEHIRKQAYRVVFRAVDNVDSLPLADIKHFDIRVVGPAPKNLQGVAFGNGITITWQKPNCKPVGYFIYRRIDSSFWHHGHCEIGAPAYTGFQLLDTILNPDKLTYYDDGRSDGLSPGVRYCYIVTAMYLNDGQFEIAEGYASNEFCGKLKKDVPVITLADVQNTDATIARVAITWTKPVQLDTIQNPGPYFYIISHTKSQKGGNWNVIKNLKYDAFSSLTDTALVDSNLNTIANPWAYKIEFYNTLNKQLNFIGKTVIASTIYLSITPKHERLLLNWSVNTPWKNYLYVVYKKNPTTLKWDSISATRKLSFIDSNLTNGTQYCYKIESYGTYNSAGFIDPIINHSQEVCNKPLDTIAPCPPELISAISFCDSFKSNIKWLVKDTPCNADVTWYKIYFSKRRENNFQLIDSVIGRQDSTYSDTRNSLKLNLAGCYAIVAVDSYGNHSAQSNFLCVDNCPRYELPNVFTPGMDGQNDLYTPLNDYRFIQSIEFKIYNRWGQIVYTASDPAINWDGKEMTTKKPLPAGVYFYTCVINQLFLDSVKKLPPVKGTITIIR
ncbi:MAG: gliding motility-associated C-terminal domain-containing protein [Bacteroidetes bacterium]|nr:gliding motility-associated C-terminal domain-containing protein [Bacteroidota bacterium]